MCYDNQKQTVQKKMLMKFLCFQCKHNKPSAYIYKQNTIHVKQTNKQTNHELVSVQEQFHSTFTDEIKCTC